MTTPPKSISCKLDFFLNNMRYLLLTTVFFCFAILQLSAQDDFYAQELLNLSDLSRLSLYRAGEIEQLSSYDTTDGNDDGFSGKYSYVRKEGEGFVIADLKGPGVVNRIWTPTPSTDTLKFYFDGEKKPRISISFIDLFTAGKFPFVAPLCGSRIGGFYCYVPVPYEKSLKIVYEGKNLRFHQTQYRTLRKEDKVKSFSKEMLARYSDHFERISAAWSGQSSPLDAYGTAVKSEKLNLLLLPGVEQKIFAAEKGGRIVGMEIGAGSDLLQSYRKIMLSARWDNEPANAIELPLHDFFGFAFGKPSMQSMALGSDGSKLYSYLPMPFDESAGITLTYEKSAAGDPDGVMISGTIYYTEDKRDKDREGKLYAQSRRQYNAPSGIPHLIADIQGKGHYIGTILTAQGLEEGHTMFWEGDDITTIDGEMRMHGTGSEDYFNGGYYAVMDKWDRGMSLPIHGSLEYDLTTARTGGYRFFLSDKLNFSRSFKLTIEHQPEASRNVQTDYTSVGLFYAGSPQFENTPTRIGSEVTRVAHRYKLTPQGMVFSLYWLAAADYQDPSIVFSLEESDSWMYKIDIEAIPVAQIFLNNLDNGRYKLFVEYGKTDLASPFTIWQRSTQISDWISPDEMTSDERETVYAGDIEITDELNTITLRKKLSGKASVRVYSFLFEKIDNAEQ